MQRLDRHAIITREAWQATWVLPCLPQVFKIDDHMGIAISGLTADGRILCRYMRNECLNHRYVYESPMPLGRLVRQVADKAQVGWEREEGRGGAVGSMLE